MKKLFLKRLTILMFALFAIVALVMSINVKSVRADETDDYLKMNYGASVRLSGDDNGNGLRFVMGMSTDDYETLMSNVGNEKTYKDVSFGMLIAPADYLTHYDLTVENVFGDSAKYDWADDSGVYSGNNGASGSKVRIINKTTSALHKNSSFGDGYYYACSIVDITDSNIDRAFVGKGYVKYTDSGDEVTYKMAGFFEGDIENSTRSMLSVAISAIESGDLESTDIEKLTNLYVKKVNFSVDATGCTASASEAVYGTTITLSGSPKADCSLKYVVNGELIEGNSFVLKENTTVEAINVYNTALSFSETDKVNKDNGLKKGLYVADNLGLKAKGSLSDWAELNVNGTVLYNGDELAEKIKVTQNELGANTLYITNSTENLNAVEGDILTLKAGYDIVIDDIHYMTDKDYSFFFPGQGPDNTTRYWRCFSEIETLTLSLNIAQSSSTTLSLKTNKSIQENLGMNLEGLTNESTYVTVKGANYSTGAGLGSGMDMSMDGANTQFKIVSVGSAFTKGQTAVFKKGFAFYNDTTKCLLVTDENATFVYLGDGNWAKAETVSLSLDTDTESTKLYLTSDKAFHTNLGSPNPISGNNTAVSVLKNGVVVSGLGLEHDRDQKVFYITGLNLSEGTEDKGTTITITEDFMFYFAGAKTAFTVDKSYTFVYLGNKTWAQAKTLSLSLDDTRLTKDETHDALFLMCDKAFHTNLGSPNPISGNNIATSVLKNGATLSGLDMQHDRDQKVFYIDHLGLSDSPTITIKKDFMFYFAGAKTAFIIDKEYKFSFDGETWSVVD